MDIVDGPKDRGTVRVRIPQACHLRTERLGPVGSPLGHCYVGCGLYGDRFNDQIFFMY